MPAETARGARRRRWRLPSSPQEWTRRKLQVLLAATALVVLALAYGVVTSVVVLWEVDATPPQQSPSSERKPLTGSDEDALAAAPLPPASLVDAQPGSLSTESVTTLALPSARLVGAAGVPSGFPHTPEGALAQLVAIDRSALEPAVVGRAQDVISAWAAPGGPTAENWSGVAAVAMLLSAAGLPATGAPEMQLRLDPAMGFIKGTVGDDFVVPCVDFVVTATIGSGPPRVHRVAMADCQRMVWHVDRWVIGPGPEPAPAPSLWPGTPASLDAGYRWLEAPAWTD